MYDDPQKEPGAQAQTGGEGCNSYPFGIHPNGGLQDFGLTLKLTEWES